MDHTLRDRLKARIAKLRERFGDDDEDVKELTAIAQEAEAPATKADEYQPPQAP